MDTSAPVKSIQHANSSPDGAHIAILSSTHLDIRTTSSFQLVRKIAISAKPSIIRWSPSKRDKPSTRILLSDGDNTRVWDMTDRSWNAIVNNGSGGMGKIVNAEFGRTNDEVLLFSDFASKVTVWSLISGRSVEIRDHKFATRGYEFRPTLVPLFALLARPGPQDVLSIHAPNSYKLIKAIILPSVDAQGLKWSPDGRWIAIWETASMGLRIFIYTADGHLYRIYNGDDSAEISGLGVKCIQWSPNGQYLAIGSYDRRVTLLNTRTFSPVMFLDHTAVIQLSQGGSVWQEQISTLSERSYAMVPQPVSPPTAAPSGPDPCLKTGISIITFNSNGTMIATRDDSAPTTVWIWDLTKLTTVAVIIQHSPVRQLSWHPSSPSLLLIQSAQDEPVLYFWNIDEKTPQVLLTSSKKSTGRLEIRWLRTKPDRKSALLVGDALSSFLVWPNGKDPILYQQDEDEEGNESTDSLYEALTGRSPTKGDGHTELLVSDIGDELTEIMDDTFMGRKQMGIVT